jgi:endoglucanase
MSFVIRRGTNISHWLSQSKKRGEERRTYFTNADVKRLADWELDHLRIPIDEEQMWREDGAKDEEAFDLLNQVLDWCAGVGLKAIVDLHILRSHYFNDRVEPALFSDEKQMQRFADLWRDLSEVLHTRPDDLVAYEILNESVARQPETWNKVYRYAYDAVREREPERTIVLGSNDFCKVFTFPDLEVPDDPNMILTFHYYHPMLVTHYRAYWAEYRAYTGPIQYPGFPVPDAYRDELNRAVPELTDLENQAYDRELIKRQMRIAHDVAQKTGHLLYCGEFGAIDLAPLDIRLRWYQDMISVFDELGIAWATWDYKGDFGLLKPDGLTETGIRQGLGL